MNTVDAREIQNFSKDSARWWDEAGPFAPLHRLGPTRLAYLRRQIDGQYGCDGKDLTPYKKLKILDVGCGGGLVCEPMARLGGNVTGIDADTNAIATAKAHAAQSGLSIDYQATTTTDLLVSFRRKPESSPSAQKDPGLRRDDVNKFDVVFALEIIEHVSAPDQFVRELVNLTKPGGLIILSTLNRTPKSYALGIVAAEHILRWVAQGTHDWKKFIKPSELTRLVRQADATPVDITGMIYNPFKKEFALSKDDVSVNYFLSATRRSA